MSYRFPEELGVLQTWLAGHGLNLAGIVTERQAAFHAQKLAGTYHTFPGKGQSCRTLLLEIQAAVVKRSQDRRHQSSGAAAPRPKRTIWPKTIVPAAGADHVFYIDGACSPNPGAGGWAFVGYMEGQELKTDYGGNVRTTNNEMELTSLYFCLEWIWVRHRDLRTIVRTDSEYSKNVATVWCNQWAARGWKRKGGRIENLDLVKQIHRFMLELPLVTIEWVRGHADDPGNERADKLAEVGRLQAISANDNRMAA